MLKRRLAIFVLAICNTAVQCVDRPIIGILTQEFLPEEKENYRPANSFIITTYVKAVEAAGARVVPIPIKKTYTYYKHILYSINGIVIPGGYVPLEPGNGYYDTTATVYKIAKSMNDRGIYFPIFAVCLGMEALLIISNKDKDFHTRCDILNEYHPLTFQPNYKNSLMYSKLPDELYIYLKYFDTTGHWHGWCSTASNFTKYGLDKEWTITGLSRSSRGLEFVSTVEHKKYPFYAVQFHPERQFSEFFPYDTKKYSRIAIKTNRYFYELVVDLAKMNENKFEDEQELRNNLIYRYSPIYEKNAESYVTLYTF